MNEELLKNYIELSIRHKQTIRDWVIVKDNWREIQKLLGCYRRICPYCGTIHYCRHFTVHLRKHHKVDKLSYVLLLHNLTEHPECSYSQCHNKVGYDVRDQFSFAKTCCPKHKSLYIVESGNHHWSHKNLKLDSDGKSILHRNNARLEIERGNHNWLAKNLKRDERGMSIHHSKIQYRIHSKGYGNMQWWNYDKLKDYGFTKEQVDQHNSEFKIRSTNAGRHLAISMRPIGPVWESPIEELLVNLCRSLGYRCITQYEVITNITRRFIDCYLVDYNIGLECDGEFKYHDGKLDQCYIDRKHEIQSSSGIIIKNIPSHMIKYVYSKNPKLLDNLIHKNDYPLLVI